MKNLFLILIFTLFFQGMIFAQTYPSSTYYSRTGRRRSPQEVETMKRVADSQRSKARIAQMQSAANGIQGGSVTVSGTSAELMNKAKKYIGLGASIENKYQDFLKLPKTGIVMLLSERACSAEDFGKNPSLANLIKSCPSNFIYGNGKYFSFRQSDYVDYDIADIGVKDNFVFSFGTANQGILTELGDVDLQEVTLESKGVDFLAKFNPSVNMDSIIRTSEQFENGLQADGFYYGKITTIEKDMTYALRVVAYKPYYISENPKKKSKPFKTGILKHDTREDIIVAFRVVEKTDDGSIVLVWKELRRINAPELLIPVNQNNGFKRIN